MKTRDLTKIAICVAILCISAYISIPLPFTPAMITAQTLVVNIIALILKPKESFIAIIVYISIGIIGIPVFSGATAGIGKLLGPTGGFILGFLVAVPIISVIRTKYNTVKGYLVTTIFIGMPLIYLIGTIQMCIITKVSITQALSMAVFPFIIGDLLKAIGASIISNKLNEVI